MIVKWAFLCSLLCAALAVPARRSYDTHNYYVLRHNPTISSGASLDDVVRTLDVELVEQAGEIQDHWIVRQRKPPVADISSRGLAEDPVISTFEALKSRALDSATSQLTSRSDDDEETHLARRVVESVDYLSLQTLRQRVKRAPPPVRPPTTGSSSGVAARFGIEDPMFPQQWHLVNDEFPEHMMNVTGIWDMGIKGKGIISSLVDDGLDYTSDDLKGNFDEDDSYDFNDHQKLPTPKNFDDHHGTRCAGQIAAEKNAFCGIGIAHESKVAGVRILSGPITDVDEAAALNYGFQNVSIYSCSWGPPDNGQSMEGPNYLIQKAVVNGINNGRAGKGSIFVFASGNGAAHGDQCNFDGYTNSIYSVTVSAVDYQGLHPYYSEPCAANMIVAYSSGSGRHIVTSDKGDKGETKCATTHGGTSAAAPNAVGVFALALEVRPDLTWRDIQHLCVETARTINVDDPDWEATAKGRKYSYKYGFGVLDGYAFVKAAEKWNLVKPQAWLETKTIQLNNGTFGVDKKYVGGEFIPAGGIESKMSITKELLAESNVETLEHINVKVWIDHKSRGEVEVEIISPNGIKSVLGGARAGDRDPSGYPGWTFMSVKHWGENPIGDWTLRVKDQNKEGSNGTLLGWNMILWGSAIDSTKTIKYEVPLVTDLLPPVEAPHRPIAPPASPTSSTVKHTKPTAHLPGDHGEVTGENSKPAFPTAGKEGEAIVSASATSTPTPAATGTADLGWFSDMSSLVTGQKWFFVALGAVSLFGVGVGVFFWRRRAAIRAANYTALDNDANVGMSALGTSVTGGPRTTRELYDAFGEVSDDDDDETTALRQPQPRATGGLGFHSGFLDDDEPATAGNDAPRYRDVPESSRQQQNPLKGRSLTTPTPDDSRPASRSDSRDSWEHASKD